MGSEREPRGRFFLYTEMGTLKQVFSDSLRIPWGEALKKECPERDRFRGFPRGESFRRQKCEKRTTVLHFSGRPGPARVPIRGPCLGVPGDFWNPLAETCEISGGPLRASLLAPFWCGFGHSRRPPSGSARSHPETEALQKRVQNGVPGRVKLQTVLHFAHGGVAVWRPIGSARVPGGCRFVVHGHCQKSNVQRTGPPPLHPTPAEPSPANPELKL